MQLYRAEEVVRLQGWSLPRVGSRLPHDISILSFPYGPLQEHQHCCQRTYSFHPIRRNATVQTLDGHATVGAFLPNYNGPRPRDAGPGHVSNSGRTIVSLLTVSIHPPRLFCLHLNSSFCYGCSMAIDGFLTVESSLKANQSILRFHLSGPHFQQE